MTRKESEEAPDEVLDVIDFPHLSTRPTFNTLLTTLGLLAIRPPSWDDTSGASTSSTTDLSQKKVQIIGNPSPWLTSLVSSSLKWLPTDESREIIWETASIRLSERCGRAAMPSLDRSFRIPSFSLSSSNELEIKIHEPTWDGDNLGLKTWGAAYALGKRIGRDEVMRKGIRIALSGSELGGSNGTSKGGDKRVLELGAGTGLAGLALAGTVNSILDRMNNSTDSIHVHLTDLPDIVPNLQRNVKLNNTSVPSSITVTTGVLDWRLQPSANTEREGESRYPLIIAADPLYSPEHPALLSTVVKGWLERSNTARFIVELPLRKLFGGEVSDFRNLMAEKGFSVLEEGEENARDDWGESGESMTCWWAIYGWIDG
ncbi:hypothetical protein TWF569_000977 [Orbilia oligospora]|uniref:Uncharacterized protein n=1 Tax=Orbilia oligospora TaxID=2813651 RepID=A0A7C8NI75_ORBOL|nr:hypothetical protein TWF706_002724 [Orbilia oligospora]KAF3083744.1 hypothetical protein TWF102_000618 [Orbilia oligospora]KAF3095581.1 hypothetical protein TWF103_010053 [Orbilia oligospora]KAF3154151.1 hypothetical protein TWF569_000977 [Orbilia oligospora]